MTFDELWAQLCKKRPALEKSGTALEFKSQNLRRLLRQVYEQGQMNPKGRDNFFGGLLQ